MLAEYRVEGSMSKPGCPYDNASMESFFATLKKERIYRREYVTIEEVKADMFRYIETLQDTNTRIWSEWLPALQVYSLAGAYNIEAYLPPKEGSEEMSVAIWVPLKKD